MDANKILEIRLIRENPRFRRYPEYKESGVEFIGEMPTHWEAKRLGQVSTIFKGGTPKRNVDRYFQGDLPWARPVDITALKGALYIDDTEIHISEEALGNSGARRLPTGTVLLTSRATIGVTAITTAPMATNQGFANFVCNERLLNIYLVYYLQAIKDLLISLGSGSTFLEVTKGTLVGVRIPLPPLAEQRAIVNFLNHKNQQIDELIRIKERRIELLREQRTALINQAVTKGLDPNVEMKPSGVEWIGVIPAHWNAVPLTKYLESIIDYRGRTPEKTEDGRFLITAKNIRDGQIDYEISQEFTSEDEYQRIMTRGIPQIGDVLFTTEAPLGEVANVDDVSIALAQRIIKFRPKPDFLNPYFLKYWILSYSFQSDLQRYATGSTAKGIKASKLCLLKLNLPPLKEQKQIVDFLDCKTKQIDDLIAAEHRKIELLKEYRQSLISEAVTGKIDVRNEV